MDPPFALLGKVVWGLLREKHEDVTLDEGGCDCVQRQPDKSALSWAMF
jgi:hypothetical protein